MPVTRTRIAACAALLVSLPPASASLHAQVPEGSAVVGTHALPRMPGTAGLFLVPLADGPMTAVTGLPPELRPTGSALPQGVASVSYRCADGAIVVGTVAAAGGPTAGAVELFVLHLNGTTVDPARTQRILLGTTSSTAGAWNELLPDGRILVVAGPFTSGPMAGNVFAIVDTSGPTASIAPLPDPPVAAGTGGGIAVDPTGRFVYFPLTVDINSPSRVAYLHRMELATSQVCTVASWPGHVAKGIFCDDDGAVYVSATDATALTHFVHTVQPNGCNPAVVTSQQSSLAVVPSGLDLDRATGRFAAPSAIFPGYLGPQLNSLSLIDPATGSTTVVAGPPPGGWGVISPQGVAVNNAIESYGPRSDSQAQHHWFENFPNPGGQPTVGNAGFTLTMRAAPSASAASVLALSPSRGSTPVLGVELLVDLASTTTLAVPSAASVVQALPIPSGPNLRGAAFTAQSVHLETSGKLAASRGLQLTIR